jgi:multimeric flavodoxin WrbA
VKALLINCTLKASPEKSNTEALAEVVADALREGGVEVALVRAVDHSIPPGVESEMGEGDEWPGIRSQILDSAILIFATPTWLGRPSSIAQRVLERMDAMLTDTWKPTRVTSGRTPLAGPPQRTCWQWPARLKAGRSRPRQRRGHPGAD